MSESEFLVASEHLRVSIAALTELGKLRSSPVDIKDQDREIAISVLDKLADALERIGKETT